MANTIRLHRVLRAKREQVYRAFLDADAVAKWLPPSGFTGKVHHMDLKVGGSYKMSFTNFTTGKSHTFGGTYQEIVFPELIRYTNRFDDPNLPGEMQTTITLKPVSLGTDLTVVQEGVPEVIPPEACYFGWQDSLTLLSQLVEPEIPDFYILYLIGGEDEETAALTAEERDDLCHITFRYRDRILAASAEDFFEAFCQIRRQLEPERLIPFCYGASLNVYPSGMSRSMGSGLSAYRHTTGRQALTQDLVSIFDAGPDVIPASVDHQREHFDAWIQSLRHA